MAFGLACSCYFVSMLYFYGMIFTSSLMQSKHYMPSIKNQLFILFFLVLGLLFFFFDLLLNLNLLFWTFFVKFFHLPFQYPCYNLNFNLKSLQKIIYISFFVFKLFRDHLFYTNAILYIKVGFNLIHMSDLTIYR